MYFISKKRKFQIFFITSIFLSVSIWGGFKTLTAIQAAPKIKLINAFNKTKATIQDEKNLLYKNIFIDDKYIENLYSNGVHINGNVKFKSINENGIKIYKLNILKKIGINFDYSCDIPNKKLLFNSNLEFMGLNLINYNAYTDNDKIELSIPQLYDKWICFKAKNIEKQYNNSIFAEIVKIPEDKEISLQIFNKDYFSYKNLYKIKYLFENLDIENLFENFENISVEKLNEKKTIQIENDSIECTAFSVNIPKEDISKIENTINEFFKNNSDFKNFIYNIIQSQHLQNNSYNKNSKTVSEDSIEIINDLINIFDNISIDDINAVFYVDNEDRIIDFSIKTNIYDNDNKIENLDFIISGGFKGKNNLIENTILKLEILSQESTNKIIIDFNNKENIDNNNNINNNFLLSFKSLNYNTNTANLELESNIIYNKEQGKINGDINVINDYDKINILLNGYITPAENNKSIDINFDDITLNLNSNDFNNTSISLSYKYNIEALKEEIKESTGKKLDIFNISKLELANMLNDIYENIYPLKKIMPN